MNKSTAEITLENADARCRKSGGRLTKKRKRALSVLLDAGSPISAYELKDEYERQYKESLTAMSAYRMLNFLVDESLAHKLHSVNKYAVCEHINCDHSHDSQQFLICDSCEVVREVQIDKEALLKLKQEIAKTGFKLNDEQLELHGTCSKCAQ